MLRLKRLVQETTAIPFTIDVSPKAQAGFEYCKRVFTLGRTTFANVDYINSSRLCIMNFSLENASDTGIRIAAARLIWTCKDVRPDSGLRPTGPLSALPDLSIPVPPRA